MVGLRETQIATKAALARSHTSAVVEGSEGLRLDHIAKPDHIHELKRDKESLLQPVSHGRGVQCLEVMSDAVRLAALRPIGKSRIQSKTT